MTACTVVVGIGRQFRLVRPCWSASSQRNRHVALTQRLPIVVLASRASSTHASTADAAKDDEQTRTASAPSSSPFVVKKELQLYESRSDVQAKAQEAYKKCIAGGACGLVGFAGVLLGGMATMTPQFQGFICACACAYAFKHFVISRRSLAGFSMRHVERITVLPVASDMSAPHEGAAADGSDAEAQLAATPEVEVRVETANLDLWVKLTEPVAAWKGAKYSGFMADDRVSFGELVQKGDLFHLDPPSGWGQPGSPVCPEPELLRALTATSKVVSERRVTVRADIPDLLKLDSGSAKVADSAFVSSLKARDESSKSALAGASKRPAPVKEMEQFAFSSIVSGCIFLAAGGIYVGKFLAQDGTNGKDATVGDLMENLKRRAKGSDSDK